MKRRGAVGLAVAVATMCVSSVAAQSPFGGTSTEMHLDSELSSNSAILAMMASPVTGEPYEAQKVTRSVWHLADGTVISHEAETKIARDGQGRIREEIENTHAMSVGGKQLNRTSESVTIADPVDHSLLIMTGAKPKLAIRMQMPNLANRPRSPTIALLAAGPPPLPSSPNAAAMASPGSVGLGRGAGSLLPKDEVRTEDLGQQSLAGLLVRGTRTTTTIPLREIGNDRPITITHEEWYSPDLKLVVKSEDNDPRSGERTMELEGLTLGEPDAALFRAPEGVKVEDMAEMMKGLGSGEHAAEK